MTCFPSCLPQENSESWGRGGTRGRSHPGQSPDEPVGYGQKKEEKSEEESPAEERKPREHWGYQGKTGMGQQPQARELLGTRQLQEWQ